MRCCLSTWSPCQLRPGTRSVAVELLQLVAAMLANAGKLRMQSAIDALAGIRLPIMSVHPSIGVGALSGCGGGPRHTGRLHEPTPPSHALRSLAPPCPPPTSRGSPSAASSFSSHLLAWRITVRGSSLVFCEILGAPSPRRSVKGVPFGALYGHVRSHQRPARHGAPLSACHRCSASPPATVTRPRSSSCSSSCRAWSASQVADILHTELSGRAGSRSGMLPSLSPLDGASSSVQRGPWHCVTLIP